MNQGSSPSGMFLMGLEQAEIAWTGTSMLARVLNVNVSTVMDVLRDGSAAEMARCLQDMEGAAFASVQAKTGLDPTKAIELHVALLELICEHAVEQRAAAPKGSVQPVLDSVKAGCLRWIEGGDGTHPDLSRINAMIKGASDLRLALISPVAPVLGTAGVATRAKEAGYPFGERPARKEMQAERVSS